MRTFERKSGEEDNVWNDSKEAINSMWLRLNKRKGLG
jgi:hypothetical protein